MPGWENSSNEQLGRASVEVGTEAEMLGPGPPTWLHQHPAVPEETGIAAQPCSAFLEEQEV